MPLSVTNSASLFVNTVPSNNIEWAKIVHGVSHQIKQSSSDERLLKSDA